MALKKPPSLQHVPKRFISLINPLRLADNCVALFQCDQDLSESAIGRRQPNKAFPTVAAKPEASIAYYSVSGGPIIVTCHSKRLESSTRPAENPSTGCFMRSGTRQSTHESGKVIVNQPSEKSARKTTSQLFFQQQARLRIHQPENHFTRESFGRAYFLNLPVRELHVSLVTLRR